MLPFSVHKRWATGYPVDGSSPRGRMISLPLKLIKCFVRLEVNLELIMLEHLIERISPWFQAVANGAL